VAQVRQVSEGLTGLVRILALRFWPVEPAQPATSGPILGLLPGPENRPNLIHFQGSERPSELPYGTLFHSSGSTREYRSAWWDRSTRFKEPNLLRFALRTLEIHQLGTLARPKRAESTSKEAHFGKPDLTTGPETAPPK
jgi:hypothetical protein